MVGPHITAAAAEAAVNALCEETACPREIFNAEDDCVTNGLQSPTINCETERLSIYLYAFLTDAPESVCLLLFMLTSQFSILLVSYLF